MIPVPQTKANQIGEELWFSFMNMEPLGDIKKLEIKHEIEKLEKVDFSGALLARALLAGINDDSAGVLRLYQYAQKIPMDREDYLNWSSLLFQLGLMKECYTVSLAGWKKHPDSNQLLEQVIGQASAHNDTIVLEESLSAWHKLNPSETHSHEFLALLDICHKENDQAFVRMLDSVLTHDEVETVSPDAIRSKRTSALIDKLLSQVED